MRKLQDNPLDQEAIKLMYNTQKDVSVLLWMQCIFKSTAMFLDVGMGKFKIYSWSIYW